MRNIIATLILLFLFGLQVAPGGWAAGDEKDGAKRTKFLNELTPDEYFMVRGQPDMKYVLLPPEGVTLGGKKDERPLVISLPGKVGDKHRVHIGEFRDIQAFYLPQAVFSILIPPPWSEDGENLWSVKEGDTPALFTTFEFLEATVKDIKARRTFTPTRILLIGGGLSGQAVLDAMLADRTPFHGAYIWMRDMYPSLSIDVSSLPPKRVLRERRFAFLHIGTEFATADVAEVIQQQGGTGVVYMQWFKEGTPLHKNFRDAYTFIASTEEERR